MENVENKYFIDEEKYNCPFCHNRGVKYVVLGIVKFDEKKDKQLYAVFVRCSLCHKTSMHILKDINKKHAYTFYLLNDESKEFELYSGASYNSLGLDNLAVYESEQDGKEYVLCYDDEIIMSIPTSFFTIDERIPRKLRDLINEAEKCIQNNCLTGASACIRKSIYEFLLKEKAKGSSYEEKMKSLKGKYKMVDDDHIDILSAMQGIMCDQVHESSIHDSFSSKEAKAYIELLKDVFNQVYVIPSELKAKKANISNMFGSLKRQAEQQTKD